MPGRAHGRERGSRDTEGPDGFRTEGPGQKGYVGPTRGRSSSWRACGSGSGASRAPAWPSQAATGTRSCTGRRGGTTRPSGSNWPVSSKRTTPLHSRLHPCSGWLATLWAASRSGWSAGGHGGRCGHIAHLWLWGYVSLWWPAARTFHRGGRVTCTDRWGTKTHRCRRGFRMSMARATSSHGGRRYEAPLSWCPSFAQPAVERSQCSASILRPGRRRVVVRRAALDLPPWAHGRRPGMRLARCTMVAPPSAVVLPAFSGSSHMRQTGSHEIDSSPERRGLSRAGYRGSWQGEPERAAAGRAATGKCPAASPPACWAHESPRLATWRGCHIQPFRRKRNASRRPTVAMTPNAYGYPSLQLSSGMCVKFMP